MSVTTLEVTLPQAVSDLNHLSQEGFLITLLRGEAVVYACLASTEHQLQDLVESIQLYIKSVGFMESVDLVDLTLMCESQLLCYKFSCVEEADEFIQITLQS